MPDGKILHIHGDPAIDPWLQEQHRRRQVVHDVCHRYPTKLPTVDFDDIKPGEVKLFQGVLVNEKYKVAYTPLPKVACTSWKTLLLSMSGAFDKIENLYVHDFKVLKKYGWIPLNTFSPDKIGKILKTYRKFLMVRHPYKRLHSAFTEKFQDFFENEPNPDFPKIWEKIIRQYKRKSAGRPQALTTEVQRPLSFEEFLQFVADPKIEPTKKLEPHWTPFYLMSSPCAVKYDYILKMETLTQDADRFLGSVLNTTYKLTRGHIVGLTDINAYKNISKPLMQNLWSMFQLDFELFGYQWPIGI